MIANEPLGIELPDAHRKLLAVERDRVAHVLRAILEQGIHRDAPLLIVVSELWTRLGVGFARVRWTPSELKSEVQLAEEEHRVPTFIEAFAGDDAVELLTPWPDAMAVVRSPPPASIPVLVVVGDHVVLTMLRPIVRRGCHATCN